MVWAWQTKWHKRCPTTHMTIKRDNKEGTWYIMHVMKVCDTAEQRHVENTLICTEGNPKWVRS